MRLVVGGYAARLQVSKRADAALRLFAVDRHTVSSVQMVLDMHDFWKPDVPMPVIQVVLEIVQSAASVIA